MDKNKVYAYLLIGLAVLSLGWVLLGHYNHTGETSGRDAISAIQRASELNGEAKSQLSSADGQLKQAGEELSSLSSGLSSAQDTTERLTEQSNADSSILRQSRDINNDSISAIDRATEILGNSSGSSEVNGENHQ